MGRLRRNPTATAGKGVGGAAAARKQCCSQEGSAVPGATSAGVGMGSPLAARYFLATSRTRAAISAWLRGRARGMGEGAAMETASWAGSGSGAPACPRPRTALSASQGH